MQEKRLLTHLCRIKKRYLERDSVAARNAFSTYSIFYKKNYRKDPTFDSFAKSSLYDDFLKFGKYVCDLGAINPIEFSKFIIDISAKENVPIHKWCRDELYERFLRDMIMKEDALSATSRTLLYIEEWAISTQSKEKDFFRAMPTPQIVSLLKNGRVSPWVMLNCQSGQQLLSKMSAEQISICGQILSTKLWLGKFKRMNEEVDQIRTILKGCGL